MDDLVWQFLIWKLAGVLLFCVALRKVISYDKKFIGSLKNENSKRLECDRNTPLLIVDKKRKTQTS